MPEQVRVTPAARKEEAPEGQDTGAAQRAEAAEALAKTDALLDEIDALLEEQGLDTEVEASAFVAGYVQKGGE